MSRDWVAAGLLLVVASCGEDAATAPGAPATVTVLFRYHSPVPESPPPITDPDLLAAATGCVHHHSAFGGPYVLEGSWSESARFRNPAGDCRDECTLVVTGVPVGVEHVVRMRDLDLCHVAPWEEPITFQGLSANGVALTRVADHGSGMRGAAFRVAADAGVTP